MNVILVLIDSLNRDALGAYGCDWISTPNLDRFAQRARRFDAHRVGTLPCIPARREIFAGHPELAWRPWGPLEPYDEPLPRRLEAAGYSTGIVTDHYHYWDGNGDGYLPSFSSSELVRGHELDAWRPPLASSTDLPRWVQNIEQHLPGWGLRYYTNVHDFVDESQFFPARVFTAAAAWLERRDRSRPFFLQVESFDVHEPFHSPEPYASMYSEAPNSTDVTTWPPYHTAASQQAWLASLANPAAAFAFLRGQYAGKVTMVDRWFGELICALDRQALWSDTTVIVTTDHGHDLGQRERFGKQFPHHDSHACIPLLIAHPQLSSGSDAVSDLTTTVDLNATIAELAGLEAGGPYSNSLVSLVLGQGKGRDAHIYGSFAQGVCATDGRWTVMLPTSASVPLYAYTSGPWPLLTEHRRDEEVISGDFIPGVEPPQWRWPLDFVGLLRHASTPLLYCISEDPEQRHDRFRDSKRKRAEMLDLVWTLMQDVGTPREQLDAHGLG